MTAYAAPAHATVLASVKRTVYVVDAEESFKRHRLHHAQLTYNILNAFGMLLGDIGAFDKPTPHGYLRVEVVFFSMYNGQYHDICSQLQLIPRDYSDLTARDLSTIEMLLMNVYHWQKTPFTAEERDEFLAGFAADEPDTPAQDGVFEWGYTIIKKEDAPA